MQTTDNVRFNRECEISPSNNSTAVQVITFAYQVPVTISRILKLVIKMFDLDYFQVMKVR